MKNVMKKALSAFLALALTATAAFTDFGAFDFVGTEVSAEVVSAVYTYTTDGNDAVISGLSAECTGKEVLELNIPSTIDGKTVTKISAAAFSSNLTVKSVTIPDTVTEIGSYAFNGCTALESIYIPSSVTTIGDKAVGFDNESVHDEAVLWVAKDSAAYNYAVSNLLTYKLTAISLSEIRYEKNLNNCWVGDTFTIEIDVYGADSEDIIWSTSDNAVVTVTGDDIFTKNVAGNYATTTATVEIISANEQKSCEIYAKTRTGSAETLSFSFSIPFNDIALETDAAAIAVRDNTYYLDGNTAISIFPQGYYDAGKTITEGEDGFLVSTEAGQKALKVETIYTYNQHTALQKTLKGDPDKNESDSPYLAFLPTFTSQSFRPYVFIEGLIPGSCQLSVISSSGAVTKIISAIVLSPTTEMEIKCGETVYNGSGMAIVANRQAQMTAVFKTDNNNKYRSTDKAVWSSSDNEIATISSTGLITAKKSGSATITCEAYDEHAGVRISEGFTLIVSANVSATDLTIKDDAGTVISTTDVTPSLYLNESMSLTLNVTPINSTDIITWSSSNKTIAEITDSGATYAKILGKKTGSVTITATASGGRTASVTLNVYAPATSISLNQTNATLAGEQTLELIATRSAGASEEDTIVWSTSNANVATVDANGKVTAKTITTTASVTITAKTKMKGITASCTVTVQPVCHADYITVGVVPDSTGTLPQYTTSIDPTDNLTCYEINCGKAILLRATQVLDATIPANVGKTPNDILTWTISDGADKVDMVVSGDTCTFNIKLNGTVTVTVGTTTSSVVAQFKIIISTAATAVSIRKDGTTKNITQTQVQLGTTQKFVAVLTPTNSTDAVTWSSGNTSIATVDAATGVVTAVADGEVIITATAESGVSADCNVTVFEPTESVSFFADDEVTSSILRGAFVGDIFTLTASAAPLTTSDTFAWSSANTRIATVVQDPTNPLKATVTVVAQGTCNIQLVATSVDGTKHPAFTYQVTGKIQANTMVLDVTEATINVYNNVNQNSTKTITATTDPVGANETITWVSSNPAVVEITPVANNNKKITIKGLSKGQATVTATTESGLIATALITVELPVTNIAFNPTSGTIAKGDELDLLATITPEGFTDTLVWTSSNAAVATVDENGLVTAIGYGTSQIKVTAVSTVSAGVVKTATFTLTVKNNIVDDATLTPIVNQVYNAGTAIAPEVELTDRDGVTKLVKGTDYNISFVDNKNVGTVTYTITGRGNYYGSFTGTFDIIAAQISGLTITPITDQNYTGVAIVPAAVIKQGTKTLTLNNEFTAVYENNINAGVASIIVTGVGNYTGTVTINFNIIAFDISKCTTTLEYATKGYTGSALEPTVTVKRSSTVVLVKDTDYTVAYSDNLNAGTATVTVTGINGYSGVVSRTFTISKVGVNALAFSTIADKTYNGAEIKPSFTVKNGDITLLAGTDYDVTFSSNTLAGTGRIDLTFKGNYSGAKALTFKILPKQTTTLTTTLSFNSVDFDGTAKIPDVVVRDGSKILKLTTDYIVSYKDNIKAGTATVTITARGNYTGTIIKTYTIKPLTLKSSNVTLKDKSFVYTGSALTTKATVNYGTKALYENTDYTVTYKNNTAVGIATVTITGIGNYKGTVTKTFKILPQKITNLVQKSSTTSSITLGWKKALGSVTGYEIYRATATGTSFKKVGAVTKGTTVTYKNSSLSNGTQYKYKVRAYKTVSGVKYYGDYSDIVVMSTRTSAPKLTLSAEKQAINVSWKKLSKASGYEIYISTKKSSGYELAKEIATNSTLVLKITGLKSSKRYYVKARTFIKIGQVKVHSSYSTTKNIKAK